MATHFVKPIPAKTVYKVALKVNDSLYKSPCKYKYVGIHFRLHKKAQPVVEKTPIFCFDNVKDANEYKTDDMVVLKCVTNELYGKHFKHILPLDYVLGLKPHLLYDFWCIPTDRKKFRYVDTVPNPFNNVLVASLTPIMEIK